jgi:O-antigen biosynthesis protein
LNDARPRFWSKRFRHITALALAGDLTGALSGLYWFVTRRRVRGWSKLLVAASLAEQAYARWVSGSEPSAFDAYRAKHPRQSNISLGLVIVCDEAAGAEAASRTSESVRRAFGANVALYSSGPAPGATATLPSDLAAALDMLAGGGTECEWVLPLLAGDLLSPHAHDILRRVLAQTKDAALIYWDEDAIEAGRRCDPWIKPGWDELLFGRLGGLAGASMMSLAEARKAARSLPGLALDRGGLERLQNTLATNKPTSAMHVPLVLTHRSDRTRLPPVPSSARSGGGSVGNPSPGEMPKVSVIVPTRDRADLLGPCLGGIAGTSYSGQLELIIVDNGTVDGDALRIIDEHEARGAKVIRDKGPFNFSRLNNSATEIATGEFLCFYNNDVEPIDPAWLQHMMRHALDERSGAIGALLLYPSGRIQHAGVAVGLGGAAGHVQKGVRPEEPRFRTWHSVTREVTAVTGAVMVVRKSHFAAVGAFDEAAFPVAFNDVDLCLRLKQAGLRNIFVAEARLLHRESESRGDDRRPERAAKFAAELAALQQRWNTETFDDPHFSPLFHRATERCVLVP